MADPIPNPWPPAPAPAPASTSPNPWSAGESSNPWNLSEQLSSDPITAKIKELFGREMSLNTLVQMISHLTLEKIPDVELVTLIEMGIYFARKQLGWTEAAANLEYWLAAGADAKPSRQMNHRLIMELPAIVKVLCRDHYSDVVGGAEARLKAPADTRFPSTQTTITGPSGEAIVLSPNPSPLRTGGQETLYKEASTPTTLTPDDIFHAVGAVWLDSKVTVQSEVLDTGGWRVSVVSWESWFWDTYDWNQGVGVTIPLRLFERLNIEEPIRSIIMGTLSNYGIDPSALNELSIRDTQMKQIEGKKITMPDGRLVQPKAFFVYGDSSWTFDPEASCKRPTVWTVNP
jgi:hypothetical protein